MRATEALAYITGEADRELMTHYDPELNLEDTKEAKRIFRAGKKESLPLFEQSLTPLE